MRRASAFCATRHSCTQHGIWPICICFSKELNPCRLKLRQSLDSARKPVATLVLTTSKNQSMTPSFADYLVHESAHVCHKCRRCSIGLPDTRTRNTLLQIHYAKRETFAYACEAYSRILTMGVSAKSRRNALELHAQGPLPNDDVLDRNEYLDILREAVSARNGWKRILQACAPKD